MFKKILFSTILMASVAFATWDKFPVLEKENGQIKIAPDYYLQHDVSSLSLQLAGRYAIIPNFELGASMPIVFFTHEDGNSTGRDGIGNFTLLLRYQLKPILSTFLDFEIPIGDNEVASDGLGFHFGAQFSKDLGAVNLGTELGLRYETAGEDNKEPPLVLNLGAEGDFKAGLLTPYIGADLLVLLGNETTDGKKNNNVSGSAALKPYVGASFKLDTMISLDFSINTTFGKDYLIYTTYRDNIPIDIVLAAYINF